MKRKIKLKTYDDKVRVSEDAKRDKASKSFILSVRYLVPLDDEDREDLKKLGFDSLREFIQCSTGLVLDAETFVKLAFAYWVYRHKACDVINYLVTQEGWTELLNFVPAEYQVDCGCALGSHGGDRRSTDLEVKKTSPKSNTKAHLLARLERDSLADNSVKEVYEQVKKGELTPNAAAIELGWRKPSATIKKDVPSAVKTLKKLFNKRELQEIKNSI